ncbi:uncharacterized protein TM35_000063730 [Trypanosoma theileri]|uniref:Uncharacterized protein n=1 Tax=Trypanosoma theileri TaxID=67003 RepID=A0A1X0P3I9_9TRYP|nr:uncharacterized protein TM35_000063730 [Trypanosoma theileri]ORC91368.1 hypothetical protein TM35_000063730 [Trypanosoma theileri]
MGRNWWVIPVLLLFIASWILIVIGFSITLFESPVVYGKNYGGRRITKLTVLGFIGIDVDVPIEGANFTWVTKMDYFHYYVDLTVQLPYGFAPQHVFQKYNFDDIPCKEFTSKMKVGQVFTLFSIFACLFSIVFLIAVIFIRSLLLLLCVWIFGWITVICNAVSVGTLFYVYLNGFCVDDRPTRIPPGLQFSMPAGGTALFCLAAVMLLMGMIVSSIL